MFVRDVQKYEALYLTNLTSKIYLLKLKTALAMRQK